jgi:hypothetical protein
MEETYNTPYPSHEPMDVAKIVGIHATLDFSGSSKVALPSDMF